MKLPPRIDALLERVLPAWVERTLIAKGMTFAAIGCVNASVDFAVFTLLHLALGLPIIPANLISWCVAVTNSYMLNSKITFAAESGGRLAVGAYLAFAATQVGGLIANTVTVFVASFFIPVLIAKVLAIGASFVVDFTLSHLLVFRSRGAPARPREGVDPELP
ncbi:MAG: GtrA family protein [Hyphomicrobiales bacterium]|nr:GtrA family protein [Hyphomicrobiales bacterium]